MLGEKPSTVTHASGNPFPEARMDREDSMNRYHPHRDLMGPARFLAFFWACLVTWFLLSFWP